MRRFLSLGAAVLAMTITSAGADAATDGRLAAALGIVQAVEHAQARSVVGTDPDGNRIRLSDFRGKVVFLNFWATWCVPCRREMPAMESLYREFTGQGLVVLAVNFQESPNAVRAFIRELKLTFPVVLDPAGEAATKYLVRGLPATYLIDRDQVIVGRAFGAKEWDSKDARAYIRSLLGDRR